jgi:hypothetical protein
LGLPNSLFPSGFPTIHTSPLPYPCYMPLPHYITCLIWFFLISFLWIQLKFNLLHSTGSAELCFGWNIVRTAHYMLGNHNRNRYDIRLNNAYKSPPVPVAGRAV